MNYSIQPERAQDATLIEALLDRTFGFERKQKTVYRLREGVAPVSALRFVALSEDGTLLGSLRYWPVVIDDVPALLLGPLAVEPSLQGQGIGKALVAHGMAAAKRQKHRLCVIVGAPDYYRPYGFTNASVHGLILPGPVDPERFLVAELKSGALEGVSGVIGRHNTEDPAPRLRRAAR